MPNENRARCRDCGEIAEIGDMCAACADLRNDEIAESVDDDWT